MMNKDLKLANDCASLISIILGTFPLGKSMAFLEIYDQFCKEGRI